LHFALRISVSIYQDAKPPGFRGDGCRHLTGSGEPTGADEGERLIPGDTGIGVDGGQIDLVEAANEIRDDVAVADPRAAFEE
jgi:hypothetical protein